MPDNTKPGLVLMQWLQQPATDRADVADGWYVQIARQYSPTSLAVGPYPSQQVAESAMIDSLLIDGFCETDCLDAAVLAAGDLDLVVEVVIIDEHDPDHFGPVR